MSDSNESGLLEGVTAVWIGAMTSATALLEAVEKAGATVERLPLIEFAPPKDKEKLNEILDNLDGYDWIAFTSVQAVRVTDGRDRPRARIAAVGPGSASQLRAQGWSVDLVPARHDAEGLAQAIVDYSGNMGRTLFVRGDKAGRVLPDRLTKEGFDVVEVEGYSTRPVGLEKSLEVLRRIENVADLVIAGSSSGVRTLEKAALPRRLGDIKSGLKWLCLGKATQDALFASGVEHAVFPREITPNGIVESAVKIVIDHNNG